ncbi:MAG: acyltransferase family protein [Lachnospiraceae bacterium]|nr:acyltransferase family protein [Lachnospiraceae bacterium]
MSRDARLDNIKALLIFFVVLGHSVEYLCGVRGGYGALRAFIYSFHMPAFVFVSGFLARKSKSALAEVTIKYLSTYMIFNTLFALTPWHDRSPAEFLYPQFIYWYLLCLWLWRALIKTISTIRFAIPFSIIFTLYIGTCVKADRFMSISRAACFFTFFLIGYLFPMEKIEKLKKSYMWVLLLGATGITLSAYYLGLIPVKMYEYIQSYEATKVDNISGIIMRIVMITVSMIFIGCLLKLMPGRESVFTIFGRNSIVIYLIHIFIIKATGEFGFRGFGNEILNIGFCILFSLLICIILSRPLFAKIYNVMIGNIVKIFVPGNNNQKQLWVS